VRVVVQRLDRSRFVDLRLAGPPGCAKKEEGAGTEEAAPGGGAK
jgi:hypothetical protein